MTERLDRIEAILERHTDEIDTLLGAVSTTEIAINNLVAEMAKTNTAIAESNQRFDVLRAEANAAIAESNQRFDVLRAEAITDRQETAQKFNDAIADSNQRFDVLRAEGIADREEHRTSFNNAIAQMGTDREEHRTSFNRAIAQMDTDRQRSDERYQTQLEVIQSLLMALGRTNRDVGEVETAVGQLGNRVDNLEAS
jgi:predicted  nucleic acid-binding Zn-ribbon protein